MVKVKTFVNRDGNCLHHENLDNSINKFIAENGIDDIIDIKYSTSAAGDSAYYYWKASAMLIYNDHE